MWGGVELGLISIVGKEKTNIFEYYSKDFLELFKF